MRRLRPQEKKRVGEFHLIRGVDEGVNFARFMRYVTGLRRKLYFQFRNEQPTARFHLRNLRTKRAKVVARNQSAPSTAR
jgi:hypothetical protein